MAHPTEKVPRHRLKDDSSMAPPMWASAFAGDAPALVTQVASAAELVAKKGATYSLLTYTLGEADHLDGDGMRAETEAAYDTILQALQNCEAPHPVRIWNHIPQIHAPHAEGIDRYMAFNAGRYAAYSRRLGGVGAFDKTVPTASAVGHDGPSLIIHALGAATPGVAVANPRQVAPHRYSRRFGPVPPCFARATLLPRQADLPPLLFVGGTASIRGEDTIHRDHIAEQTAETFLNLAHLVRNAAGQSVNGLSAAEAHTWLSRFTHLRIYYVNEADRPFLASRAAETFAPECEVELIRADLCRAELRVEIEGLAAC